MDWEDQYDKAAGELAALRLDAWEMLDKIEKVTALTREALAIDGVHHKQWYLHQIALALGLDISGSDPGIAP